MEFYTYWPWETDSSWFKGQWRVNWTYLLVPHDQYPHNLTVHLGHEGLQPHPILTNSTTTQDPCGWGRTEVNTEASRVCLLPWILMKWLHSHLRGNYRFWSCSSDSWGVSQRRKICSTEFSPICFLAYVQFSSLFQDNHHHQLESHNDCPKQSFHLKSWKI